MPEPTRSPDDYLLRVAAEEIAYMEKAYLLQDYPHLVKMLHHPVGGFVLRHVQNLCWTMERWAARRRTARGLSKAPSGPAADPIHGLGHPQTGVRPTVWIDITNTVRSGFSGGMERAASKLAKAALETGLAVPVFIKHGEIHQYTGAASIPLQFTPDVTYVVADSFWQQIDEYRAVCLAAKAKGAKVALCIHDVIPLYYPSLNRVDFVRNFAQAFDQIIEWCDACIASSMYSQEKVKTAIRERRLRIGRPLPLTHFHLGADGHRLTAPIAEGLVRSSVSALFDHAQVFLSVGTLEPRKGYAVTLDAFDALWQRNVECRFAIIGRPGWITKALEERILNHPRYGERLHWISDASDAELTLAYRKAYCLIQASITEGFGLPIVEANLEGTPVIAADNAVFRELAGNEIVYFRNCDALDLADRIEQAVTVRPEVGRLDVLRWDDSLAQMVARLQDVLEHRQAA